MLDVSDSKELGVRSALKARRPISKKKGDMGDVQKKEPLLAL